MEWHIWCTEPLKVLSSDMGAFRLVVHGPDNVGGPVHFLVLRRTGTGVPANLIGSGTVDDVRAAMTAAERMAERCNMSGARQSLHR